MDLALALSAEESAAVPMARAIGHLSRAEGDLGLAAELAGDGAHRSLLLEVAMGVRAQLDRLL